MKFTKGHHYSPSTEFKKGFIPWNKGKKGYTTSLRGRTRKDFIGERNPSWKGDHVGYHGLHRWIIKQLGKPCKCKHCGKDYGRFMWADKSGEYKRELEDWIRLCYSCHHKYDQIWVNRERDLQGRFV